MGRKVFVVGVGMTKFVQHNLGLGGAAVVTLYRKAS